MAIQWQFNSNDYEENSFAPLPVGDHRVRIANAEETKSKNGNDMVVLTLDVSGHSSSLWYYLVFMPDNPQMTNNKLGQIFNSFGITPNDMNTKNWIGKVGGARVKHEKYNGEDTAKVSYFLTREKVDKLPAWADAPGKASVTGGNARFEEIPSDDSLPF